MPRRRPRAKIIEQDGRWYWRPVLFGGHLGRLFGPFKSEVAAALHFNASRWNRGRR